MRFIGNINLYILTMFLSLNFRYNVHITDSVSWTGWKRLSKEGMVDVIHKDDVSCETLSWLYELLSKVLYIIDIIEIKRDNI